ncbi:MAG: hypothetical protein ABJB86_02080 [Bacteroidota bacterium]
MTLYKILPPLTLLTGIFFCSSCIESSYFQHPLQGNNSAYHAMPVASDSVKSATYVNGALSAGGANDAWRDALFTLQAGLHRAHVVDNFRISYGASMAVGSYKINSGSYYNYYYSPNGMPTYKTGATFFGAYGLYGGVSAATSMGRRGEWRYIGVEGSLFNEFGNYYNFRKNLSDSQATEIDRKKYLGSLGVTTEWVFKGRSKTKVGIKIGAGSYLRRLNYINVYQRDYYHNHDDLLYFSVTNHYTFKKNTVYFQFNLATHAAHFQVGYNFRL